MTDDGDRRVVIGCFRALLALILLAGLLGGVAVPTLAAGAMGVEQRPGDHQFPGLSAAPVWPQLTAGGGQDLPQGSGDTCRRGDRRTCDLTGL